MMFTVGLTGDALSWLDVHVRPADVLQLEARGQPQQRLRRADAQETRRRHAVGEAVDHLPNLPASVK